MNHATKDSIARAIESDLAAIASARREAAAFVARGDNGSALYALKKVARYEKRIARLRIAARSPPVEPVRPEMVNAIYRRIRRFKA